MSSPEKKPPITDFVRWHLADLLDRYKLVRKRGGQRTPS